MAERVDVVVLGLGVGGEELANTLADNGLNVIGIEEASAPTLDVSRPR